ncbi:MAG: protein BatD [Armatimonadetes bacterium]|nr:protein BatD [Armatimonadota bacterium]
MGEAQTRRVRCWQERYLPWLAFLVLIAQVTGDAHRVVQVEASLDRQSMPLDRTAWLTITVRWDGATDAVEVVSAPEPKCRNAAVVSSRTSDEISASGESQQSLRRYQYRLKPDTLGMAYVEPASVVYRSKGEPSTHTLTTNRLSLKVLPGEEEGTPMAVRVSVLILATCALAGLVIYVVRSRVVAGEREEEEEEENASSQREVCRQWQELEQAAGTREAERTLFPQSLQLIRGMVAVEHSTPWKTASPEELARELLHRGVPEDTVESLRRALFLGDRVKFANYEPTHDELTEAWRALRKTGSYLVVRMTKEDEPENG